MARKTRLQKSVDPRVAAILIVVTLAAVQYFWWQGLVAKPKARAPGAMRGGGGGGPSELILLGNPDARVDTVAGGPEPGFVDGPGWAARFDGPSGIAATPAGNLLIADTRNDRIRLMAPSGKTTTLAGSRRGYQDGDARTALFDEPSGVAAGADGSVYVADTLNNRIRRIRSGQVTTVAGGPPGYADGPGPAARFKLPAGLAVVRGTAGAGEALLVADTGNARLRLIRMQGDAAVVTTVGSTPGHATAIVAQGDRPAAGAIAIPDKGTIILGSSTLVRTPVLENGLAGPSDSLPQLTDPLSVAAAPGGWYAIDGRHGAVFAIRGGRTEVLAGRCARKHALFGLSDGDGERALFGLLGGVTVDVQGRIYVSDLTNNCIRRITPPSATSDAPRGKRSAA